MDTPVSAATHRRGRDAPTAASDRNQAPVPGPLGEIELGLDAPVLMALSVSMLPDPPYANGSAPTARNCLPPRPPPGCSAGMANACSARNALVGSRSGNSAGEWSESLRFPFHVDLGHQVSCRSTRYGSRRGGGLEIHDISLAAHDVLPLAFRMASTHDDGKARNALA